jgi:hypothetical protein
MSYFELWFSKELKTKIITMMLCHSFYTITNFDYIVLLIYLISYNSLLKFHDITG